MDPPTPPPSVKFRNKESFERSQKKKEKDLEKSGPDLGPGDFCTAARRQYVVIAIVNLATFLQGASLPTSSISVPRLLNATGLNDTTWPVDFSLTESEGDWIGNHIHFLATEHVTIKIFYLQHEPGYSHTLCLDW